MLRARLPQLREQAKPVQARQEQVEDDELVRLGKGALEPGGSVVCAVHDEPLRLEAQAQELENPGFVFDDQDPHLQAPGRPYPPARGL